MATVACDGDTTDLVVIDPAEFQPQPGDFIALEHWGSSRFANTDLALQHKRHGIHRLVAIGLIAHTSE